VPLCKKCTIPVAKCVRVYTKRKKGVNAHLMVEATPPRRMVSLCSVKGTILARGYSSALVESRKLVGLGWKKKVRPAGA
jgi:hypothetical protein